MESVRENDEILFFVTLVVQILIHAELLKAIESLIARAVVLLGVVLFQISKL